MFICGQDKNMLKHFLTVEEGLSNNEVTSIVQDHDGFIWIGTRGGLNRYDGYDFKVFNQIPGDSNSLVNPSIESLFVDNKGNVWIGTKSGGVSKYDPITGVFKNIVSNYKQESKLLPDNRILSFYEDKLGRIWIGTWTSGLIIYDEKNSTSERFIRNQSINSIIETSTGKVWVGTGNGLYEYIEEDNSFNFKQVGTCTEISYDDKRNVIWLVGGSDGLRKFDLRNYKVYSYNINGSLSTNFYHTYESLLIDKQDRVWVGTWGTGFYNFSPEKNTFERYLIYPENRQTLNKDYDAVLNIFQDKDNNIWLATNGGGVCVLTPKLKFNSVGYHPEPGKGLTNTRIMSVLEDSSGNLWLGTIGSGLFWSPDRKNYYPVKNPLLNKSQFFIIKSLFIDADSVVWAGTNRGTFIIEFIDGLPRMARAGVRFGNPVLNIRQAVSFLDSDGMLWFGTLQRGLFLLNKDNNYTLQKQFSKNNIASGDLKSDRISYLLKDSKERVWIGTYNGLHIFNKADTTIQLAENCFEITGDFTGNIITCLDEDQKGTIWIGTPNGLNKLTETGQNKFKVDYFTENNGLASNFIKGISHDSNGNIWFSTSAGISKFEVKKGRFINFDETDGVRGKNFTEASVFRNNKGEIFFGGTSGLTYFSPDKIGEKPAASKPVFTGLTVLNQPLEAGQKIGSRQVLTKSITHTKEIELSYHENNFEINFSALDFQSMGKNHYEYLLENHDEAWNSIGHRHFVNFNNLKPGEYTLKVRSLNSHNILNEDPAELKIQIRPPFWQTWYALVFYILIVVGIVSIIRWNAIKQVRLTHNLEMEKYQHDQDQELSEMKFRFFTNISHEFRTPLTLILAPLKELINKKEKYEISDEFLQKIGIVQKNSMRLMTLINQLIDFRKTETGKMKLRTYFSDLEVFVNEVCLPFYELAKINEISFGIRSKLKSKQLWFDREKLEIILNNLISNAFKFISVKGKIEVALYDEEDEVLISVSDNGRGIPATEVKHIFDRFYRVERGDSHEGSGIGLALVKHLVELHKGTISVTSIPNISTEFIVSLPKGDSHLTAEQKVNTDKKGKDFIRGEQLFGNISPAKLKSPSKSEKCILIVEDNPEVNLYLESLLSPFYCVERSFNGLEAYKKALALKPDLILSDVMMPKMDGFELCKRIKTNEQTSTIPIILLTAKSADKFKTLSTQIGADDYISKPFDPEYLIEKIGSLLLTRSKLKKQFSKSVRLEPSDLEITSTDEFFIGKVISIIEKNLQNNNFTSEVLASELNKSSSSLYRKLKSLTGSSTAEFIRSIRIKRAAQFLADREKTISEIAYDVGFNDVKHFRTIFKKQFNCSPSEYRKKL